MGTRVSRYAQYTEPVSAEVVDGWRHCHCALIRGVHFAYEHDLVEPSTPDSAQATSAGTEATS